MIKQPRQCKVVLSALLLTLAMFVGAGCLSRSDEAVIPDVDSVPPPSAEPGVVPDQDKMKRVKIE